MRHSGRNKKDRPRRNRKTPRADPLDPLAPQVKQELAVGMGMRRHLVKRLQVPVDPQPRDVPRAATNPHLPQHNRLQGHIGEPAEAFSCHRTIIMSFLCYRKRFFPLPVQADGLG